MQDNRQTTNIEDRATQPIPVIRVSMELTPSSLPPYSMFMTEVTSMTQPMEAGG